MSRRRWARVGQGLGNGCDSCNEMERRIGQLTEAMATSAGGRPAKTRSAPEQVLKQAQLDDAGLTP